ncbi:hypothetical protein ALO83_104036 [Pseudomonas cannabina pv. alisalensis]|uniref:Uncharacterized protein n=1 Tax=Pseudomonas cannabina TaxID=86840 RepID=A0AB37QDY4_PSECA|nr:Uncharacterized protein AC507_4660 [Pseudomonas syringae pv. maculicola]KPW25909.1 hypothetical protein ALO83_104036 [Pseudomonas cannabina pv. alisalensis]RMN83121.1 hypothetical protein ALQ53_103766 [Pseudomonas cannabina]RMN83156.1 hypothetical protein ALQ52_104764 [Pseudomonas cannabina pv. alisalensis]
MQGCSAKDSILKKSIRKVFVTKLSAMKLIQKPLHAEAPPKVSYFYVQALPEQHP